MTHYKLLQREFLAILVTLLIAVSAYAGEGTVLIRPGERHFASLKQLTFGGENAEAYFSFDGRKLIFQSTREPYHCDQIYTMNVDGSDVRVVSTGQGRTTCSYFFPDGQHILYSSTHMASPECPPRPDYSKGYVWPIYRRYDIFTAMADGSGLKLLTVPDGYDAEATISPKGDRIVFTSVRDGDLELYSMNLDGSDVWRLTHTPGYDGGAFFSPDGKQVAYRAYHPTDSTEVADYTTLLKEGFIRPGRLEIFVMDADGSNVRQVTNNGAANFAPYFHPDGKRIIFSSNLRNPKGRNFDLYLIGTDGTGLEQITMEELFDGFPMFSSDGKWLVFASNRNGKVLGETNVFIAEWSETPVDTDPPDLTGEAAITPGDLLEHVRYLASDALQGRLSGTSGADSAAAYIARQFSAYGLEPAGDRGTYEQGFEFVSGTSLGEGNRLVLSSGRDTVSYEAEKDFRPLVFSQEGTVEGEVVFAGYGIVAPDLSYDDYRGLNVSDRIVLILRETPDGATPHSKFYDYAPLRRKTMVAREKGAKAVLFVTGPTTQEKDELIALKDDVSLSDAGVPAISVSRQVAEVLFHAAGRDIRAVQMVLDSTKVGGGFPIPSARVGLTVRLIRERSRTANVVGYLPGREDGEYVLVGAHYDHLGLGASGSLAEKPGEVHNGADDNASGTAGLLELAEAFGKSNFKPKRGLLFVAFTGEERGALGSNYYTQQPAQPLQETVAMLNMDMIGRLRGDSLAIGGNGTSSLWGDLIPHENVKAGLTLALNEDGYGPSDHSSFYARDIPVLFFFTGAHEDYHKPSDDVGKINAQGMAKVANFVFRLMWDVADRPDRPAFVRTKPGKEQMATRGFRVYLGTIPDYLAQVEGVKLTGVRAGGPAEQAGIKGGDVIVGFGGRTIKNIYDYTFALQEHKPEENVEVVVLREGREIRFTVRLESRQ